jgi:hypothetical protein
MNKVSEPRERSPFAHDWRLDIHAVIFLTSRNKI